MSHTPHELAEEFPQQIEALHALKLTDAHFNKLADEYHELKREIHRIESDVEPTADHILEEKKKLRLGLKDQIAAMLNKAQPA